MSISVHCLYITALETHFNNLKMADDMQRLLDGDSGRDKVKCKLRNLTVEHLPLEVRAEDIGTVAIGFKDIFPCLADFAGYNGSWSELKSELADRQRRT